MNGLLLNKKLLNKTNILSNLRKLVKIHSIVNLKTTCETTILMLYDKSNKSLSDTHFCQITF